MFSPPRRTVVIWLSALITGVLSMAVDRDSCKTDQCKILSDTILAVHNPDTTVSPCENFHEFACGKVTSQPVGETEYIAPEAVTSLIIMNATKNALKAVNLNNASVSKSVKLARRYFDHCLTCDPTKEASLAEVSGYFKSFADWPLLSGVNWNAAKFNLYKVAGQLQGKLDLGALWQCMVLPDKKEEKYSLYIKPLELLNARAYYIPIFYPSFRTDYIATISRSLRFLATQFGVTNLQTIAQIPQIAADIADFEIDLAANVPLRLSSDEALLYSRRTLASLNKDFGDKQNWNDFFSTAFRGNRDGISWVTNNKMLLVQETYFSHLTVKLAITPINTVANYLMWRLYAYLSPYFNQDTNLLGPSLKRYAKFISGPKPLLITSDHEEKCFRATADQFPYAVGRLYVEKRFSKAKLELANNLTKEIVKAAREVFTESSWLTPVAKSRILLKLDRMALNVAYPSWLLNNAELDKLHVDTELQTYQGCFHSAISLRKWDNQNLFRLAKRTNFELPVSMPRNAEYVPSLNSVTVPAGAFEYPFFHRLLPDVFNYAVMGFTIAHEMSHGFDDTGSFYDEDGKTSKSEALGGPWLLEKSNVTFNSLSKCFQKAFNEQCYTGDGEWPVEKLCINGNKTLGENIADYLGMKISRRALSHRQRKLETPLQGPLAKYTEDQLYYLSYASQWCSHMGPNLLLVQLIAGDHSPDDARTNVLLKNVPDFAKAFQCRAGQTMVAAKPCHLY